jgi:Anaphase-promoting complex APC subunit CDC26
MLSRRPTAIKLTQEDIQDYDNHVAAQQDHSPQSKDTSIQTHKSQKGKEAAPTAQDRQQTMDERIGVTITGVREARR